jgi:ribulose-bisphosphate carboxylase large chain
MSSIQITYRLNTKTSKEVTEAIRVEQTIEFPYDLAPEWIQKEVVGQVVSSTEIGNSQTEVVIDFNTDTTGFEIGQMLNVVWGNVSMFPDVKVTKIEFPEDFLNTFKGPRFGISGVREILGAKKRPILATALKPMGLSSTELAKIATVMVEAGIDLIKDDHSLANQPWAKWNERVKVIASAVVEANQKFNRKSVYAPSINRPAEEILECAITARKLGSGALMVLPGISGFDTVRMIADNDEVSIPLMSHPSTLGSHFMNSNHGLNHEIVLATVMRLSGADISVFPNYGGRFSFSKEECTKIADSCRAKLGNMKPIFPSPGGGMTLERIPEIANFFGNDTFLLIGGALHRGDLLANAKSLRTYVETLEN